MLMIIAAVIAATLVLSVGILAKIDENRHPHLNRPRQKTPRAKA